MLSFPLIRSFRQNAAELEDLEKELYRLCILFVLAHEFGHVRWNASPQEAEGFGRHLSEFAEYQRNSGHKLNCVAHISEATDEAAQLITSLTSDNFEEIVSTLDLEEVFCDRIAIEYLIAFVHDGQFF